MFQCIRFELAVFESYSYFFNAKKKGEAYFVSWIVKGKIVKTENLGDLQNKLKDPDRLTTYLSYTGFYYKLSFKDVYIANSLGKQR